MLTNFVNSVYDTIHWWLPAIEYPEIEFIEEFSNCFDVQTEGVSRLSGLPFLSGQLRNIKVSVYPNRLSLKGSLAKFYFGNPAQTLTLEDTRSATHQLSTIFGINFSLAHIRRIDFADNLVLDHAPESYFQYLGDAQYFQRIPHVTSLYYRNKVRELCFYNKIAELKAKNQVIPKGWKKKNVMRYEIRFKKPSASFGRTIVGKDLLDPSFFSQLGDHWYNRFGKIHKSIPSDFDLSTIKSPKDFQKALTASLIQKNGGMKWIDELLGQLKQLGAFKKKSYYSREKARYRKMCQQNFGQPYTAHIDELSQKIGAVYKKQFYP